MSEVYELRQSGRPVSTLDVDTRAQFIQRTYAHLFGAMALFTLIQVFFFKTGLAMRMARAMAGTNWLFILGGFMLVSWFASRAAFSSRSMAAQYAALVGFVLAEAIIFVPLLVYATQRAPGAISSAAFVTLLGFAGLTGTVFITRKDFSFLGGILKWAGVCALLLIVGGVIFGFELGTYFSVAMVAFAGAAILYDTSNVLNRYPVDRHVGAALALFASVALMFWYVLRLFIGSRD